MGVNAVDQSVYGATSTPRMTPRRILLTGCTSVHYIQCVPGPTRTFNPRSTRC